jgi:predicted Rossmann fold flavoprotein
MIKNNFPKTFNNLELKNVSLTCVTEKFKKTLFGEMTFVDNGISGPIVLTMSSLINKEVVKDLSIDFKPALTHEKLDERLLKDFLERRNESLNSVMRGLLPQVLINVFLNRIKVDGTKKVNEITKNERLLILNNLKKFDLTFEKLDSIERSIVTSGGVDVNEINPRTMESKLVSGLYFAGEVVDIDCFTGGFNVQCALSMGYIAGNNI